MKTIETTDKYYKSADNDEAHIICKLEECIVDIYYKNKLRHREDGPAWVRHNNHPGNDMYKDKEEYYLNGEFYSKEKYIKEMRKRRIKQILE